jgi:hypothetical protein
MRKDGLVLRVKQPDIERAHVHTFGSRTNIEGKLPNSIFVLVRMLLLMFHENSARVGFAEFRW